ncbi:hypothetical protein [Microbulbifer pacificus]|uniref:hypothetical protein n=1 Tax=Microbulbifer pacificus TaxID=407164 RepID=UPI001319EE13|nr:hypothetical protein [Microbulbifer pacificus]
MKHLENTVVDFTERATEQEMKGIKKYGKALDPLDDYDWLTMAAEEQVDGYKYLLAEMKKREYVVEGIREIIDLHEKDMDPFYVGKAHDLLNQLNGSHNKGR